MWFLLAIGNASDNKIFRLTMGQGTQTVIYALNIYKNKHKLSKLTCPFQIRMWRYHWYFSDLTLTESPPLPLSFGDRLGFIQVFCYYSVESPDTKLHELSLKTSREQLVLSLLTFSPEEDAEKGINVLLWFCGSWPAIPLLDTIMHSKSIPLQNTRNFPSLRSSLMTFTISGQTPQYYFKWRSFCHRV
jgi:hypothetical protein